MTSTSVNVTGGSLSNDEIEGYIERGRRKRPEAMLTSLSINVDGDYVELSYTYNEVPFERIRRITGYLVGDMNRFNNAKRAEVAERVKHEVYRKVRSEDQLPKARTVCRDRHRPAGSENVLHTAFFTGLSRVCVCREFAV